MLELECEVLEHEVPPWMLLANKEESTPENCDDAHDLPELLQTVLQFCCATPP